MSQNIESERKSALNKFRDKGISGAVDDVKKGIDTAKNLTQAFTPWGAFMLAKYIDLLKDFPFVLAFGAAILLDLIDLTGLGEIPGLGIICSIFIGMMLFLAGASSKRKAARSFAKRLPILLAAMIGEEIPLFDVLPFETTAVFINYMLTLIDRKMEDEERKRLNAQRADMEEDDDMEGEYA